MSMMKIVESADGNGLKLPLSKNAYVPGTVYFITNLSIMSSQKMKLWNLVQRTYEKIGGYKGHDNPRTWFKDIDAMKIVFDETGAIAAFAVYTNRLDGFKRFCSAKNFDSTMSSQAVRLIIKDDIVDYDGYYWVEASGGIETIFKTMNGNPIPNDYAREFLQLGDNDQLELMPDGVHYRRPVGRSHDVLEKMIFGFKNKEIAQRVCSDVANYEAFKINANAQSVVEVFHEDESSKDKEIEWALAIARKMNELANEWQCHEMLPSWNTAMRKAKQILDAALKTITNASRQRMIKSNLKTLEYCLHDMVLLKVHVFKA